MAIAKSHLMVALLVGACSASARSSTGAPTAPVASARDVSAEQVTEGQVTEESVLYVPTVIVAAPWPHRAGQ